MYLFECKVPAAIACRIRELYAKQYKKYMLQYHWENLTYKKK